MIFFWKPQFSYGAFSQWYNSPMEIKGEIYTCGEQWMMVQKAIFFGDLEIAQAMKKTNNPAKLKALGREVRGFNEAQWMEVREEIVYQGNLAKFTQNKSLKITLLNTGDKLLVEASPFDKIWGVGMDANHPQIKDPTKWQGLNLLGKVLMRVRSKIKEKTFSSEPPL